MSKVSAVVRDAMLLLKAVDAQSAIPPQDCEDAIRQLNLLGTRWEANGLAIGWANVAAPDDDMPSVDEAELALIYNLAVNLIGYARPSDFGLVIEQAKKFLADLQRDRLVEMPIKLVNDLPISETGGHWNIYVDSAVP
jgi:hypothetical protein